jgi:hypothetical protein
VHAFESAVICLGYFHSTGFLRQQRKRKKHNLQQAPGQMTATQPFSHVLYLAVLLSILSCLPGHYVSAQGLIPAKGTQAGASTAMESFKRLQARAQTLKAAWRNNRKALCSPSSSTICGSKTTQDSQVLVLATSPVSYDARLRDQVIIKMVTAYGWHNSTCAS